jgi:hypothetical protein
VFKSLSLRIEGVAATFASLSLEGCPSDIFNLYNRVKKNTDFADLNKVGEPHERSGKNTTSELHFESCNAEELFICSYFFDQHFSIAHRAKITRPNSEKDQIH